jgi:hypothetical protein
MTMTLDERFLRLERTVNTAPIFSVVVGMRDRAPWGHEEMAAAMPDYSYPCEELAVSRVIYVALGWAREGCLMCSIDRAGLTRDFSRRRGPHTGVLEEGYRLARASAETWAYWAERGRVILAASNREGPSFPSWDRVVYWHEAPLLLPG